MLSDMSYGLRLNLHLLGVRIRNLWGKSSNAGSLGVSLLGGRGCGMSLYALRIRLSLTLSLLLFLDGPLLALWSFPFSSALLVPGLQP